MFIFKQKPLFFDTEFGRFVDPLENRSNYINFKFNVQVVHNVYIHLKVHINNPKLCEKLPTTTSQKQKKEDKIVFV